MSRNVPHKRWIKSEIDKVKQGEVPAGRTYLQAASYAHKHNIPWKELRRKVCAWWWREDEVAMVAKGKIVPNRSWESIRKQKDKMGIPPAKAPRYSDFVAYYTSRNLPVPKGVLDEKYRRGRKNVQQDA